MPEVPSLALGTADVSLFKMLGAYTGFANNGVAVEPYGILRIEDSEGNVIYENKQAEEHPRAFHEELGMIMNTMLEGVVDSGTARSLRSIYGLRSELAGKTGTTQNNADGWFIGYSPKLVAGVWVGAELPAIHFRTTALGSGAHMALPIFGLTFKKIENNQALRNKYLNTFAPLSDSLMSMLDCPVYSVEIPSDFLTRKELREFRKEEDKKKGEDKAEEIVKEEKKEKVGFFRRIGNFFKRKK